MLSIRRLLSIDVVVQNFAAAARNPVNPVVVEDSNTLGYTMPKRFRGATKQTKATLLEIAPREVWEQMKENAWDGYILEGSYYRKDAV